MSNNNSKKIALGMLLGAAVGMSTLYLIKAVRYQRTPILHKMGRTLSEVGEVLENCEVESLSDIAQEVQKVLPKSSDIISSVLNWISSGISLLQKLRNGGEYVRKS